MKIIGVLFIIVGLIWIWFSLPDLVNFTFAAGDVFFGIAASVCFAIGFAYIRGGKTYVSPPKVRSERMLFGLSPRTWLWIALIGFAASALRATALIAYKVSDLKPVLLCLWAVLALLLWARFQRAADRAVMPIGTWQRTGWTVCWGLAVLFGVCIAVTMFCTNVLGWGSLADFYTTHQQVFRQTLPAVGTALGYLGEVIGSLPIPREPSGEYSL